MEEKEKLIDFYYSRLQAVRRAQKRYLFWLVALLSFVWIIYWGGPKAFSASFFGVPISHKTLLGVTPGLFTILLLGLVGSFRAVKPTLQRLNTAWKKGGASAELELDVIDNHQNWVDFLKFIWSKPIDHFIQASLLLAGMASTFTIGLILAPKFKGYATLLFTTYCLFCLALQAAATWKWFTERKVISRHKD